VANKPRGTQATGESYRGESAGKKPANGRKSQTPSVIRPFLDKPTVNLEKLTDIWWQLDLTGIHVNIYDLTLYTLLYTHTKNRHRNI